MRELVLQNSVSKISNSARKVSKKLEDFQCRNGLCNVFKFLDGFGLDHDLDHVYLVLKKKRNSKNGLGTATVSILSSLYTYIFQAVAKGITFCRTERVI